MSQSKAGLEPEIATDDDDSGDDEDKMVLKMIRVTETSLLV